MIGRAGHGAVLTDSKGQGGTRKGAGLLTGLRGGEVKWR